MPLGSPRSIIRSAAGRDDPMSVPDTTSGGEREPRPATRLPLVGLLLIQIFIGYEWFISGLTKIHHGDFPSGLAAELEEKSKGVAGWYKSFLDGSVIPHATGFGYALEIGELLIGIALVGAALGWLFGWQRLPARGRAWILITTAAAALSGIFMNVNFHLANDSAHPWLISKGGFDEGVDLDSLMPAIQLVLIGVSLAALRAQLHRDRQRPPRL